MIGARRSREALGEAWRSFRVATWLGWQIESNWTDPFLFAIYSVVKPVSSALILVVMYLVVSSGDSRSPLFAYLYVGNAFYIYVGSILVGVSWAVIDDREHYGTLKYIFVSPIKPYFYLLGRGVARFLTGSLSVLITLAFGQIFLNLNLRLDQIDWLYLLAAMGIGLASLAAMGLMLGSATMMMARHSWFLGESVAGALYLLCGAIFPLDVLPGWLQPVGQALPLTYWLEAVRRALLGSDIPVSPLMASYSDAALLSILAGTTLLLGLSSIFVFRWAESKAREKGLIDMQTHY